ncbi:doubled motif LPXTG anchor domain-containing protein [Negativibacillus massiliensis]|uniref:doubled motif LPXTG anchor domain-containing protein n=1 Tax=Negativibacillus massiliensis TaxID=1871035 RepID=UPI003AF5BFDF
MKNKFMRSVTAMVVAVTMLISSQGVVTSFADGGDYSDMSESSSVQMNEAGNNGTDQSTKDDAAQCTCGAKEGEPHQENCPLYVKPDDGNTNDGDTDNGDTDNGAGEDTNIKSVADTINALPAAETITEETDLVSLKDQVNAARVAYDALSDDQKAAFDAATLEKLTALEAKIFELESGEQETAPSEAVQNVIEKIDVAVEQIDYTTETITATDGTTVTKTHITMLKDLDLANNAELKALIDKEAAHEQDETQPALTDEEAAKLSEARKAFEDAKAKYLSEGFSNAQLDARQAYDALAEADKAQVTNYSLLEDMEANIAYIMQAVNALPEGNVINPEMTQTEVDEILSAAPNNTEITIQGGDYSNSEIKIIEIKNKNITLKVVDTGNGSGDEVKNLKKLSVESATLTISGKFTGTTGFSLNNATLQGKTGRSTDIVSVNLNDNCVTFNGDVNINNVKVTITGSNANYILYWQSGSVTLNNAALSACENEKGAGMFVGGVTKFTSTDSDVSFSDNGGNYSGIYANEGNQNVCFEFTGGSLTLNNNGLNGFQGARTGKPTFTFTNTNVHVTGNGSPTDGGEGDGFSYGYIKLNNTDGGTYTFDVSNNDNNGLDGGLANEPILFLYGNAALDAQGYNIIANNNGGYGIHISKLNDGKTASTIENCTITANGNGKKSQKGKDGFWTNQSLEIINSTINADENIESGLYFSGNKLTTSGNTSISLNSNQNSGLYVSRGTADLFNADVTIMTNNTSSNGGGIYNKGELTLPDGAKVYNNHATKAGDDIYNDKNATITNLPSVGADWYLDGDPDCTDKIDGWYDDSAKVEGNANTGRWEMHDETQRHILPFTESTISEVTALKAAHGIPTPPVDPEDPTPTPDPDPDPTPRPGTGGDEDDDTPTIINETPVPTTTIDDEDVPLTYLPEDTVTIDDEEIPLKDIPNTGDMIPVPAMVAAVISIGGIALLMKKHK